MSPFERQTRAADIHHTATMGQRWTNTGILRVRI